MGKKIAYTTTATLLGWLLLSCSQPPSAASSKTPKYQVIGINEYPFVFSDTEEDGGTISFSSKELEKCTLSFAKNKFTPNFKSSIDQLGKGDFDLTCLTKNDYYSISPIKKTYASLDVSTNDNSFNIHLNFLLYSTRSNTSLERTNVILTLNAKQSGEF